VRGVAASHFLGGVGFRGWVTGESECNFRSLVYIINLAFFPLQFLFFLFLYPGKRDFLTLFGKLTIQKIPIQENK